MPPGFRLYRYTEDPGFKTGCAAKEEVAGAHALDCTAELKTAHVLKCTGGQVARVLDCTGGKQAARVLELKTASTAGELAACVLHCT